MSNEAEVEIPAKILAFRGSAYADNKRHIMVDIEYVDPETKQRCFKTVIFDQTTPPGFRMLVHLIESATRLRGLGSYIEANLMNINYDGLVGMDVKGIAKIIPCKWDAESVPSLGLRFMFIDFKPNGKYIGQLVPKLQETRITTNAGYYI